jgi:predicted nucleic acid-binding protein
VTSRALADTSVFIAREEGRPLDWTVVPDEIAVSVITIGELRAGVLAAADVHTRDRRLRTLVAALTLDPVPIDAEVADRWAHLRVLLRLTGQRMGVNDSWIAATAMALGVPVITHDGGFPALDELQVLHV